MRDLDTLKLIFKSSNVKRYHIHPVVGEQNIAHHSWRLVMLIYFTVKNPSPNLIKAALLHDAAEVITGDTPYTAKKLSLDLKRALDAMEKRFYEDNELNINLFENEQLYLKACDMLELLWFCKEQLDLGNANFTTMFDRAMEILQRTCDTDQSGDFQFWEKVLKITEQLAIPGRTIYEY